MENVFFALMLLILSCTAKENAGTKEKGVVSNTTTDTLSVPLERRLKQGEIQPYAISSFNGIADSINTYKGKIDALLEKNIKRLQKAPHSDSVAQRLVAQLRLYKENYKATIDASSTATFFAVGLNHQNYNSKLKFEYFSVLVEYSKARYICQEICTTFFESGRIKDVPDIDGITPCLMD
jgi:hypothetical protein